MPNTTDLKYGIYGLRAVTGRRVAATTIEAVRRTLVRKIKRTARLWVRMQATVPVTKKPLGVRMGKGKGAIEYYACAVRPGQVVFEMDRVPRKVALSALDAVQPKFPCRLVFVEWS
ncbi:ribosomal protein L10e/L16 [Dunaliella salina]|uniref:Ribosomal protein L10e/L16 n=1 Tax=Dunaliella salina TaxID=3046 RepID=A0ABQ7GFM8_DUNSA|nr:ribosomal protein L10e/L16 [Dunaliella salina]|eukprot:KAF5833411.1 ribosomal protein L10e/L16 [Dunaliella salina]